MSTEQDEQKKQKVNINLKVDNPSAEKLAQLLEQERTEKEQEQQRMKTEPNLSDLKVQALSKFPHADPHLFLDAETKESLSARITGYINDLASKSQGTPSGSPLVNQQFTGANRPQDLYTKPYATHKEMVDDLRAKARSGSKEAQSYLDSLFELHRTLKMQDPHHPEPAFQPNSPEALDELSLVKKDGFLTPSKVEDGDLGRLQKQWREERKRKMEEGAVKA
jgi:hypothetical protein